MQTVHNLKYILSVKIKTVKIMFIIVFQQFGMFSTWLHNPYCLYSMQFFYLKDIGHFKYNSG